MADTSLDDFFAKKDKSKKKSKAKFLPTDLLSSETPSTQKEKAKKEKTKPKTTQQSIPSSCETNSTLPPEAEDEDWKDFEVEAEKDYSGLRIQSLQVVSDDDDDGDDKQHLESGDLEDGARRTDAPAGPWNKSAIQGQSIVKEEGPAEAEPHTEAPKKYIPPGARGPIGPRRAQKGPPEINSDEAFPSLSAANPMKGSKSSSQAQPDTSNFERVRHGGTRVENPISVGPKLDLGNKYDALSTGE